MKVQALYSFEAQPNSGEISINIGEILNVTREDVGEGWWEGVNSSGQIGLFPANYVEVINENVDQSENDNFQNSTVNKQFVVQQGIFATPNNQNQYTSETEYFDGGDTGDAGDDWDDDWDDDEDSQTVTGVPNYHQNLASSHMVSTTTLNSSLNPTSSKPVIVRKSYNRFSTFVKSGGEDYILGIKNKIAPNDTLINIIQDSNGCIMWAPIEHEYECVMSSFKKESKLKGLKSYIAYEITPTFNNIQVSRRYKQFDWLYSRLEEKFMTIPLPALPDKQISGRYQEDFIEHRMRQLRLWVDRLCRHPVLSQCDVWMLFLTCTDKKRWKTGKRRAEKDEFTNASFFFTIQPPNVPLEITIIEKKMDSFNRFIIEMNDSVKNMFVVAQEESRKYCTTYKRDLNKVSTGFSSLAKAFSLSGHDEKFLIDAIKSTSKSYEKISKFYEKQPLLDFEPLSDVLHEYKGLLSAWPEILEIHKGALNRKKEHIKLKEDGKINLNAYESVSQRADQISYAVLAEINHFQNERIKDFKNIMKKFLQKQIDFHLDIINELKYTLTKYD